MMSVLSSVVPMVDVSIVGVCVIMWIIVVMAVMKIFMVYVKQILVQLLVQNFVVHIVISAYEEPIYAMTVNTQAEKMISNEFFFFNEFYLDDDCGDQSDELSCHHNTNLTCANQANHCDQICHDLPNGRGIICSCNLGYRYNKESGKCEDIDECENSTLNYCSHVCINTKGGFRCECGPGFEPSAVDRSDCHPRGNTIHCMQQIDQSDSSFV